MVAALMHLLVMGFIAHNIPAIYAQLAVIQSNSWF